MNAAPSSSDRQVLLVGLPRQNLEDVTQAFGDRPHWTRFAAQTTAEGLSRMSKDNPDAVVVALTRSDSDAIMLLNDVMLCRPRTVRILLVPPDLWATAMKCLGVAHQFLLEPCEGSTLVEALDRAFSYEAWLPQESVCRLLAQMHRIPSPPTTYFQVVRELQNPAGSLENVGESIRRDPAMSARLLQLVNSAFFGLGRTIDDPADAVMYLGADTTKSLLLLAHSFSYFDNRLPPGFTIEELWRHSMATADLARDIARAEDLPREQVAQCYTAGLLHDLGKLALAVNLPKEFHQATTQAFEQHMPLWQTEEAVFQANHAALGAALLAIWGLAPAVVEAVALHHHPIQWLNQGFSPLTAVHVANALDHERRSNAIESPLDTAYLEAIQRLDRLDTWRNLRPKSHVS